MTDYERIAEELYLKWVNQTEGLDATMKYLTNCETVIVRIELTIRALYDEFEEPSYCPLDFKLTILDVKDMRKSEFVGTLGEIDNSGFADDWFYSTYELYLLLELILVKLNDKISFEFEEFQKGIGAVVTKLEDSDCQTLGSIYIKGRKLSELKKLKSVADYLDRHQLDLDIFEQCNCTEGNMSETEKYICNELVTKPGNRNLEAILDEIRMQF